MGNNIKDLVKFVKEDEDARSEAQLLMKDLLRLIDNATLLTNSDKVTRNIARFGIALSAGTVAKGFYTFYRRNKPSAPVYTIKIKESDVMFDIAEQWVMDSMPQEEQTSIIAHTKQDVDDMLARRRGEDPRGDVNVNISYDGSVLQVVEVRGHKISVVIDSNTGGTQFITVMNQSMGGGSGAPKKSRDMRIVCESIEARNDVLDELEELASKREKPKPSYSTSTKWGTFRRNSSIPVRPQESVVLKEGQMENILKQLRDFLNNEEHYLALGVPYRTGLLLHGNPGTGKTSTAKAIAYELGLNVYAISLSTVEDDDALVSCLEDVPSRSIVILEDIDVAHAVKERSDDKKGVTMSGMLNALDGFTTPHGVITIMTTNHIEVLDQAIIRPGRVDIKAEIDELDDYQLRHLCEYFIKEVPEDLPYITPEHGVTSADVIGVIKKYIPNVTESKDELVEMLSKKVADFTNV